MTKSVQLDTNRAVELLREVMREHGAEQRPDGVCVYFNSDGTPRCIIGHVLFRLGFTKADFPNEMNAVTFSTLMENGFSLDATTEAASFLNLVQHYQDIGFPWRVAVNRVAREIDHFLEG